MPNRKAPAIRVRNSANAALAANDFKGALELWNLLAAPTGRELSKADQDHERGQMD